jgi:hypothetical protein
MHRDDPCKLEYYQISKFQVGTGANATSAVSSTVQLGDPLTKQEYGNSLMSVDVASAILYKEEDVPVAKQDFGTIKSKGVVGSSITYTWSLDEETANGQLIDEAGLFVENPYLKKKPEMPFRPATPQIQLIGQQEPDTLDGLDEYLEELADPYEPGHLLAAYKQFTPIQKENYFTLLFRWSITFH